MRKNQDALNNFKPCKDEKFTLKKQTIKKNYSDLMGKDLNTKSFIKNGLWQHIS